MSLIAMLRCFVAATLLSIAASAQVVPAPKSVQLGGSARSAKPTVHASHQAFVPSATAFAAALQQLGVAGVRLAGEIDQPSVEFAYDRKRDGESYRVEVRDGRVIASAGTTSGIAWAAATLLLGAEIRDGAVSWPFALVRDEPDFAYRSFMVDMGRNPHRPQTLRAVVDMLWLCKVRLLQLHLTDDQLCSWPSAAFPKLYDQRAGWTRDDFVALEQYAAARGVAIVPELDVPGHSGILRREYPDVFGTTPTELATLDSATRGVETLIEELLDVFRSSPYMHVGGDEAYGVPASVQRAFLNRLNQLVKSKGRRLIVWEGPPVGRGKDKVATDVLHCCWRSLEFPAQQMLDEGYDVIAAPWDPMYIVDHYPRTMFTAVDLERCYRWDCRSFPHINPGMRTFTRPHRTKTANGIVGFCMPWWEGREQNLFALCLPRLGAVSAAAWNRAGERDFDSFLVRNQRLLDRWQRISGMPLSVMPTADPSTQRDNLAFGGKVTPSRGAHQPHFGPQRLTNGVPDRFDHFLGFPTKPDPLEIVIELPQPAKVARVVIYERAVGDSHEVYELLASPDGKRWRLVGSSGKGTRGERDHVEHRFDARTVHSLKIVTSGCEGLTFPSFSRLSEVMAFRQ